MSWIHEWAARPSYLLLLFLLPLLWVGLRYSLARMSEPQRRWSTLLRAAILSLLVLALAGLRIPWVNHDLTVVFAIDRSASITPEAEKAGLEWVRKAIQAKRFGDETALIGFAETGMALPPPPAKENEAWPEQPNRNATDVGKALQFASAVADDGKQRRLVLLSDGRDTGGKALETAAALKETGVELLVVPLQNPSAPEVLVEQLQIPRELREGEPFDATVVVRSNVETPVKVRLFSGGFAVGEQALTVKPGRSTVTFRSIQPDSSTATYEAQIFPEQDTQVENNRAQATAFQRGEPKILVIDPHPDRLQPLVGALAAEHIQVETRPVNGLPATLEDLQAYDALILSDVSALHLSRAQMNLYTQWVKEFGGGFAMLGGDQSYGVGGYFRTPLETMLPVRTESDDRAESPTVALMIILDSSGSMTATTAGQTKMSLANQGAALALEVLQAKDLFGVMAVDTKVHQVAPLARHPNKAEVTQNILRITAGGGGIYVYTSLIEAYSQLKNVNAKVKHVLLFSDAADAEEKAAGEMADGSKIPGSALELAAAMVPARITTSVVALGQPNDKDVPFLKQLASTGGGRFYLTNDALSLPQIFTTETMRVAQSSMVEEPVLPVPARKSPVLEGIDWDTAPLLLGYNITKLKPTADLLLATEKGDPLLATWQYGLGKVAAFTSDAKARWGAEWLQWQGYGKFWAQLIRSIMRQGGAKGGLQVEPEPTPDGKRLRITIDATEPNGTFRNQLALTVGALLPDGSKTTVEARQTAPGRYVATVPVSDTGTTWINVLPADAAEGSNAGVVLSYTPSYPAEFLNNDTDLEALQAWAEAAGGVFAPTPEQAFTPPAQGVRRYRDLSPFFLAAALLLYPVDIWLRRRSWD